MLHYYQNLAYELQMAEIVQPETGLNPGGQLWASGPSCFQKWWFRYLMAYFSFCVVFSWTGKTTWGVCVGDIKQNSVSSTTSSPQKSRPVVLLSSSESQHIKEVLQESFSILEVAGAGYKLLGVSQGHADAYILTKSSNYKWDCCGPHAVLRSVGGGIVNYEEVQEIARSVDIDYDLSKLMQIKYHIPDQPELTGPQKWCNDGGIIAYRSPKVLQQIYSTLSSL